MRKILFLVVLFSISLSACASGTPEAAQEPLCRVVTQIVIEEEMPSGSPQRLYRTQENMNRILLGISELGHKFPSKAPADRKPEDYRITLYFSDGNEKIYRCYPQPYLYIEGQGWARVDQDLNQSFHQLLEQLPPE